MICVQDEIEMCLRTKGRLDLKFDGLGQVRIHWMPRTSRWWISAAKFREPRPNGYPRIADELFTADCYSPEMAVRIARSAIEFVHEV